jgi:hypothetical protein
MINIKPRKRHKRRNVGTYRSSSRSPPTAKDLFKDCFIKRRSPSTGKRMRCDNYKRKCGMIWTRFEGRWSTCKGLKKHCARSAEIG